MDFPTPTALAKDLNNIFLSPIEKMIESQIQDNDSKFFETVKKTQDRLYCNLQSLVDSALKVKFRGPIVNVSSNDDCIIINREGEYFEINLDNMKRIELPKAVIKAKDSLVIALQNRELNDTVKYLNLLKIESNDLIDLLENTCKDIKKIEKYETKYNELKSKKYKKFYLYKNPIPKTINDYLLIKSNLLHYKYIIKNEKSSQDELSDILKLNF